MAQPKRKNHGRLAGCPRGLVPVATIDVYTKHIEKNLKLPLSLLALEPFLMTIEPSVPANNVPRRHWPNYECDEFDGLGWEVEIINQTKNGAWVECKFCHATTDDGRRYQNVWRKPDALRNTYSTRNNYA